MNPEKTNNTPENNSEAEDNSYVNFGEPDQDLLTNTYGLDDDPHGLGLTGGDAARAEEQMQNGELEFADDLPMIPEEHELTEYVKPPLPMKSEETDMFNLTEAQQKYADELVQTGQFNPFTASQIARNKIK